MQTVTNAFTAEERSPVRKIAASLQVAWKKQFNSTYKPFTIGVSTIGGFDTIAGTNVSLSSWNKYIYKDESVYLLGLNYEHSLKMPTGGLSMGIFDAQLDNTSGRFTPRYMGGSSELFTSINKTMRPTILNAGFNVGGVDLTLPQLIGVSSKPPTIDMQSRLLDLTGSDFIYYLQNNYLDQQIMFTAQRTDQVLTTIMGNLGFATAQYDFDTGINVIPFGLFDVGTRFSDIVDKLVEAENGQFYQTEDGVLKFENRQHWTNTDPVRRIIYTADVINAQSPNFDHLINVVEVSSPIYEKQPEQIIYRSVTGTGGLLTIPANSTADIFVNFQDPALSITVPTNGGTSYFLGNSLADASGTDKTSSLSITSYAKFARAAKFTFTNSSSSIIYLTELVVTGRVAKHVRDIYYRAKDDSSVTAYQEQPFQIANDYIQNDSWAASYGQMILNDFSEPENLQVITIRAKPELQLGDQISWQGRYWRIFDIKGKLDQSQGYLQELTILQRTITSYFRIGISTIGGGDKIAP